MTQELRRAHRALQDHIAKITSEQVALLELTVIQVELQSAQHVLLVGKVHLVQPRVRRVMSVHIVQTMFRPHAQQENTA